MTNSAFQLTTISEHSHTHYARARTHTHTYTHTHFANWTAGLETGEGQEERRRWGGGREGVAKEKRGKKSRKRMDS